MDSQNMKLYAQASPWRRTIEFLLMEKYPGENKVSVATEIVMETKDKSHYALAPLFSLSIDNAQELMDNLWQCGLRPTEGTGSAGSLKATQDHLKDLQSFVNRLLSMIEKTSK